MLTAPFEVVAEELELMSLSAYDPCDVNHDGKVNATDLLLESKYLSGIIYNEDYSRFDVNQNLIVDMADYDYLAYRYLGKKVDSCFISREYVDSEIETETVPYPAVSGFTRDAYADASVKESRTYMGYS